MRTLCLPWPLTVVCLLQALGPSLATNIDLEMIPIVPRNASQFFGYKVLQFARDQTKRIIVGAPGGRNERGRLYECDISSRFCEPLNLNETLDSETAHLGLTLETDHVMSRLITCGPGLPHECDKTLYFSGVCYVFKSLSESPWKLTPGYQKCVKRNVDLVFLFDGSSSMTNEQFSGIIEFMSSVMDGLRNSSVEFAAVQFSSDIKTEFNFSDFRQMKDPRKLLSRVIQMKSLTHTFKGIQYVVNNIFIKEAGAREDATQVMIIITDGDASDGALVYKPNPVDLAEERGIVRYIIGVGNNFNTENVTEYLSRFASKPVEEHVKVLSFEKLRSFFSELQKKIFFIEGTGRSFHLEMSSSGFSADLSPNMTVLGAVGVNEWAGALMEIRKDFSQETLINVNDSVSEKMKNAYLGYSVKLLRHGEQIFYAAGAPRYQHFGKVIIYKVDPSNPSTTNWIERQHIMGEQIGSYFGAELCAVDVDVDGKTDVLLIGEPFYYGDRRGGRVHVCLFNGDNATCGSFLRGEVGHPFGRFGAAITELADLNGDGFMDVAIGAPLEEEERGAVYIFNGKRSDIHHKYSQRIIGSPGIRFFGQSIHGIMDLTGDELIDIVVGAHGKVMVLRSRPILNVSAWIGFEPPELLLQNFECQGSAESRRNFGTNLTLCFNTSKVTSAYQDMLSANLSYSLELDSGRMRNRVIFESHQRTAVDSLEISEGRQCVHRQILLPNCIEDYMSPIKLSLSFSLQDLSRGDPTPVLDLSSNANLSTEIPFEKNCGPDGVCETDLKIAFHSSGDKNVVLKEAATVSPRLELENNGEDSYRTVLWLEFPESLSFRKASVLQSTSKTIASCVGILELEGEETQNSRKVSCNISHPIFRRNTKALLHLMFDVLTNSSWGDFLDMNGRVSSDNEKNETFKDNVADWKIPVLYPINVIAKGLESSTQYVNFSIKEQEFKMVEHFYQVQNLLLKPPCPLITVTIEVPVTFPSGLVWNVTKVMTDPAELCRLQLDGESGTLEADSSENNTGKNLVFVCSMEGIDMAQFHIAGELFIQNKSEGASSFEFHTAVRISFNTSKYISLYNTEFMQAQVITQVHLFEPENLLYIIIGSSAGGLLLVLLISIALYKCGFFKRSYKDKMETAEDERLQSPMEDGQQEKDSHQQPVNEDSPVCPLSAKD
ncbi:integrin alpha-L [Rhinatrema bivittatum]|uniref:integrin alpha-L n=1 Tax=Rhinatrema bivittatum TaxID=194408 RepID=UPI00112B6B3B|nr:integrin alpha-L [Rhinatrema bivittatum]